MSARILVFHNGKHYKFIAVEQSTDGSIYVSVVRKNEHREAMRWNADMGLFEPNAEPTSGPRKTSYHVSGRVNYRPVVSKPPLFFEPLFDVKQHNHFFFVSVPRASRLDETRQEGPRSSQKASAVLELPANVERFTVGFAISPVVSDGRDLGAHVRVAYDTFSLFLYAMDAPMRIPEIMRDHFVYGAPGKGTLSTQAHGKLEAELAYHQKRVGREMIIYPPDGQGIYTLYTIVVMRVAPKATIKFRDPTLFAEVQAGSKANKVRFRVRGAGGYIKDKDLRSLIESIELSSEI
jgi:hypothetical protein